MPNTRYSSTPEVIANVKVITSEGDEIAYGDVVTGIQVQQSKNALTGLVQLDLRGHPKKHSSLVIEIELQELVAALAHATLNAERID
jgi:hypothetical protein